MIFKPMKKENVLKALEGQTDILSEAKKRQEEFFKGLSCVSCGGSIMPIINPRKLFKENDILPNLLAKCRNCECEFEPYTGIQITAPKF